MGDRQSGTAAFTSLGREMPGERGSEVPIARRTAGTPSPADSARVSTNDLPEGGLTVPAIGET